MAALERAQHEKTVQGEFESACPGYCGAQDTYYVGTIKRVGRVYQQTFIDTYAKVAHAKLYTEKTPITAADLLNDRVVPFYADHGIPLVRVLTDRSTEYCGTPDRHPYELYLAVGDIDHTRTKALNEFYRTAFRKTIYRTLEVCSRTWTRGSPPTIRTGRTKGGGATARRRCKRFLTPCH